MKLIHHGCVNFELANLSSADMGLGNMLSFMPLAEPLDGVLPETMKIPLEPHQALAASGKTPFVEFDGNEGRAMAEILKEAGVARTSEQLTAARLLTVRKPADFPQDPWDKAFAQIAYEVNARELCGKYFARFEELIQNVFIANSNLLMDVASLCQLENSTVDHMELIDGAFKLLSAAIKAIDIPGFGAVGGGIDAAYSQLRKGSGASQADVAVGIHKAAATFTKIFKSLIDALHDGRKLVFNDWGLLSSMYEALHRDESLADPSSDKDLYETGTRALQIEIWKVMLKVRWSNVTYRVPNWALSYTRADKALFENAHKGHWVTFEPGPEPVDKKPRQGYLVHDHFVGYGADAFPVKTASDELLTALFDDLKVSRDEVFSNWGLRVETIDNRERPPVWSGM